MDNQEAKEITTLDASLPYHLWISDLLDGYQKTSGRRLWDAKHEAPKGEDINSLNHKELMVMEEALQNGLSSISAKQDQILEEEHKQLQYALHQKEMAAMGGNMRGIQEEVYHQRERDYEYQMPFSLRVQPMQPNLHERM
ncbi:Floral homeotic protein PMADS 2 [Datura stramonium]|uniref:Floral homeotic protein PMADS 2 n=1 Tax=Datura stramonium TaxID=4076 RepID=A0ABS8RKN2_DATST|nr:Floral homeotic protein PMADS 2 [Datura stramonium]